MNNLIKTESISTVVGKVKNLLEGEFQDIWLEGEISNLSPSSSGHYYFTLSDPSSALSAALFRFDAYKNPLIRNVRDGDKVICFGSIGVYAKRGTFQIIVKKLLPAGKGSLKEQFEKLKKKLTVEGLFDLEHKIPIPSMPKRVAVISSPEGAGLRDFINVFKKRSHWMELIIIPSLVQGDEAPKKLIEALKKAYKLRPKIDVLVMARGGGSIEDLWAFNDEKLIREMAKFPIPIISAIGHQTDFTLSDFVADQRCETPTAAAMILTEYQMKIKEKMDFLSQRLQHYYKWQSSEIREKIKLYNPKHLLNLIWNNFNEQSKSLQHLKFVERSVSSIGVMEHYFNLDELYSKIYNETSMMLKERAMKVEKYNELLFALNPKNVLGRGFTFVEADDGKIISEYKGFKKLPKAKVLKIHFSDGQGEVAKL